MKADLLKFKLDNMNFIEEITTEMISSDPEKHLDKKHDHLINIHPQMKPEDIPNHLNYEIIHKGVPDFYDRENNKFIEVKKNNDGLRTPQIKWIAQHDHDVELYSFKNFRKDLNVCEICERAFETEDTLHNHKKRVHRRREPEKGEGMSISNLQEDMERLK